MGNFLFKGVVRTLARLVRAFLYLILAMSSSRLKIWGPKQMVHNACLTEGVWVLELFGQCPYMETTHFKKGLPWVTAKAHYLLHFSTSYDPSSQNRMACSLFIHSESVNSVSCHSSVRRVSSPSPSCAIFFELLRTYAVKIE